MSETEMLIKNWKMEFIEVVTKSVPKSRKMFDSVNIPVACTVRPGIERELSRVQFPRHGIVRCLYCKAYINLYCQVESEEKMWKCSLCNYENRFEEEYWRGFSSSRPEISLQNYEIYAEEINMERPPMCPCYVFCIDFSDESKRSGFLGAVCDAVGIFLDEKVRQNEERALIAIILHSNCVGFVQLAGNINITMIPKSEAEMWLPIPRDLLLVDIKDNLLQIKSALSLIKELKDPSPSTAFHSALLASQLILEQNGGKILSFICNSLIESTKRQSFKIIASTEFYYNISEELIESQISCDIFFAGTEYCGLFTYAELARITGGEVYYYQNFTIEKHREIISGDIRRAFLGAKAWEAGLRLRISEDWKITSRQGHFYLKKDLLCLPCLQNSSFTFDLRPKYENNPEHYLNFQASLLYTSSDGIRLIRVMNYQISVDDDIKNMLLAINPDVLVNLLMKHAVFLILKRSVILAGQKFLETKAIDVMKVCRTVFQVLPNNLQDFFKRLQGLMKHALFINVFIPCKSK
jgi:protein transport protein SEC24